MTAAPDSPMTDSETGPGGMPGLPGRSGRTALVPLARWGGPLVALAVSIAVVAAVPSSYWQLELALFAFWAAVGMSWNLIGGYAGQLNLGHAAFIGLGAYGVAFFVVYLHIIPWVGLVVGAAASALMAWLLGLATVRIRGLYLGMASVALPSMLAVVFQYIQGQFLGFQETPIPASKSSSIVSLQWSSSLPYFIAFAVLATVLWYGTALMDRSRWRIILQALREDEDAAASLGIHPGRVKISMFMISAALAGIAGGFYAELLRVVSPVTIFDTNLSVQALAVCLIGGLAMRSGPIVGAFIVTGIGAVLSDVSGSSGVLSEIIYGAILILIIIFYPKGVVPGFKALTRRLLHLGPGPAAAPGAGASARTLIATGPAARPGTLPPVTAPPGAPAGGEASEAPPPGPARPERVTDRPSAPAAALAPGLGTAGALLSVSHVAKRYGGVVALRDISLDLRPGEFLGIVGPNGAGKSTLFDILTGYQRPTEGRVEVAGNNVTGWATDRIAQLGIRRSFQTPRPFGDMSVLENTAAGCVAVPGSTINESLSSALESLNRVGLAHLARRPASSLVAAQLRLLEVARALAAEPRAVLLDEPLAGLEGADRLSVMSLLAEISSSGTAVIIVDHDVGAVAQQVARLLVIDRGIVLEEGDPAQVLRSPAVRAAYLGEGSWQRAADQ
jgi:branched-chain amino acid transport system permease protein